MLVLTRKINGVIVVAVPGFEPIKVMVVDICGDKVRIGIQASDEIEIDRLEVWNVKQSELALANNPIGDDATP